MPAAVDASRLTSLPKCFSRPSTIADHERAGSNRGGYATWQLPHSVSQRPSVGAATRRSPAGACVVANSSAVASAVAPMNRLCAGFIDCLLHVRPASGKRVRRPSPVPCIGVPRRRCSCAGTHFSTLSVSVNRSALAAGASGAMDFPVRAWRPAPEGSAVWHEAQLHSAPWVAWKNTFPRAAEKPPKVADWLAAASYVRTIASGVCPRAAPETIDRMAMIAI